MYSSQDAFYQSYSYIIFVNSCFSNFKVPIPGLRQFLATESPLNMMKYAFYFSLKALSVLKTFTIFVLTFVHVEKRLD